MGCEEAMKNFLLLLLLCHYQLGYGFKMSDFPKVPASFAKRTINFLDSEHVVQLLRIVEIYPTLYQSLDIQLQKNSILETQVQKYKSINELQRAQLKRSEGVKKILIGVCITLSVVTSVSLAGHFLR